MNAKWCGYLKTFQRGSVSDQILATVIREMMFYKEALQFLLAHVQSGRRVFKQLCLKGEVPCLVYTILMEIGETDLAFNVMLSKDLWECVAVLYASPGISRQSRDLAFRKALRQRVWTAVMKMVDSEAASVGNCRRAFLEMVRWEELSLVAELCKKVSLTDGDLSFAIRACLRSGRVDRVVEFVKALRSLNRHRKLLTLVVELSIRAGTLSCFLKLAGVCTDMKHARFLNTMFILAFQSQQVKFVSDFCQLFEHDPCLKLSMLDLAANAAIKTSQWDALSELVKANESFFSCVNFFSLLKNVWTNQQARDICVPFVEKWCADTEHEVSELIFKIRALRLFPESDLADWCFRHGFPHLAFLLCLVSDNSVTVKQIVEEYGGTIKTPMLAEGILEMREDDTEGKVAIMKHLPVNAIDVEMVMGPLDKTDDLLMKCRDNGMTDWVVQLAICGQKWDMVDTVMETCHDPSVIDNAIIRAASKAKWDLVQKLMKECSQQPVLLETLREAISHGESETASRLFHMVDPCLAPRFNGNSLLLEAVQSVCNKEEMVRLCIRSGISTREFCYKSCSGDCLHVNRLGTYRSLKQAVRNGQLPLVKLLYQSGASSNKEVYHLKTNGVLRTRLERQGRGDIVEYLEQAASSPRSLQDLCRLRVSHLIGCRPERAQRIESLPLPPLMRDLVNFSDILIDLYCLSDIL